MKIKHVNILSRLAAVSAIAAVTLSFSSGCKSTAAKENPTVPPPATAEPISIQPATAQPVTSTLAAQPVAKAAPATKSAVSNVKAKTVTYSVQNGDSFSKIAKKHGIGAQELATYNNMSLQKPLQVGATLKIPQK